MWQNPEPALGTFLNAGKAQDVQPSLANGWRTNLAGAGMGGMFDPKNLNGFGYVHQNPVQFTDPDGRCPDGCVITAPAAAVIATVGVIVIGGVYILSSEERKHQIAWAVNSGWEGLKSMAQSGDGDKGKPAEKAKQDAVSQSGPVAAAADGPPPSDEDNNDKDKNLSQEDKRSIRSLEKQIEKHQQKIADFKNNPTVRPGMESQPEEVIKAQQGA